MPSLSTPNPHALPLPSSLNTHAVPFRTSLNKASSKNSPHPQNTQNATPPILVTNACGVVSKLPEFRHTLFNMNVDIAIVTETKITPEKLTLSEATIPGYSPPLRHDRTEHGGGVAIWIKSNIPFRHLDGIPCQGFELIMLSIVLSSGERAVLCSVYRPGSCSGTDIDLIRYIDQTIPAIRGFGSKLILAGDFNVYSEAWLNSTKTTHAGEMLEDLCAFHGLLQHVDQPMRG